MAKIKVFGGRWYHGGSHYRAIVATTSEKKAAEIAGVSLSEIRNFWSKTGNSEELEIALSSPGVLFIQPSNRQHRDKDFIRRDQLTGRG